MDVIEGIPLQKARRRQPVVVEHGQDGCIAWYDKDGTCLRRVRLQHGGWDYPPAGAVSFQAWRGPERPARFGDAYHLLPARCRIAPPELVCVPERGRWPASAYEALVLDLLGHALAVPGHPSSCAREGCSHAKVWHRHRTRTHPCESVGCLCADFTGQEP